MKLLGIEFFDFACFERQFVKLSDGLVLLVGKNNAGKTAILRALSLLASLPIGENRPLTVNVASYCRKLLPQANYDFHLIFAADADDFKLFSDADNGWTERMLQKKPYFRFIFRVWPNQSLIAWEVVNLHIWDYPHDPPVPIVEMNPTPVLNRYSMSIEQNLPQLRNKQGNQRLPYTGSPVATPDGKQSTFVTRDTPIVRAVSELTKTKFISAHRTPHAQMALQSTVELPSDATTLAGYLQTLQNNDRARFAKIETFITAVFPEFIYVNPSNRNNQVAITLTDRATSAEVPLTHCGTGVEQLLSLATFSLTSPHGCMLLMDEPHSFLHPSAERQFVDFVKQNNKRHFVVSTHSPILINSVEADRINYFQAPGTGFSFSRTSHETSQMLLELGYRNSDVLFNDRLIAVEGESDREILRILLSDQKDIPNDEISRTGFPVIEGAGEGARALQTAVLRFEKLLGAVGRMKQPRLYLFDGDKSIDDQKLLSGTNYRGAMAPIVFLPRYELENYLLCPSAIAEALRHQAILDELLLPDFSVASVQNELDIILSSQDEKFFPIGHNGNVIHDCKGSRVLGYIFDKFGKQKYDKKRSGVLLAKLVKQSGHKDINEIIELVKRVL